jgi:hypothetical protein
MLICDDFQLVSQFLERNDNSPKEIITFEIHEVVAQRPASAKRPRAQRAGGCWVFACPVRGVPSRAVLGAVLMKESQFSLIGYC